MPTATNELTSEVARAFTEAAVLIGDEFRESAAVLHGVAAEVREHAEKAMRRGADILRLRIAGQLTQEEADISLGRVLETVALLKDAGLEAGANEVFDRVERMILIAKNVVLPVLVKVAAKGGEAAIKSMLGGL